jgi:hypothetical protein
MTSLSPEQLAANVPPAIRDYINAVVAEALAGHAPPQQKPPGYDDLIKAVTELTVAIADLRRRYETDDRFAITRAKVIRWMQKEGI